MVRSGYDPWFLGVEAPLPASGLDGSQLLNLDYTHFTVRLRKNRRLAEVTAVNVDGATLVDVTRGDDWHFDERVQTDLQTGPAVYSGNDFDRGHLVRRRDPVWGADAQVANLDTFSYTNAAPQVNVFNQSKELWVGLEDYVLEFADSTDQRISVLTGPVFANDDVEYRGIRVPQKFFKIAGWMASGELAATAYLLDQSDLIARVVRQGATLTRELGAFRTFQVTVDEIARLTSLDLAPYEDADRLPKRHASLTQNPIELRGPDDLRW